MKIYVAMICDRHTDPEPYLFTTVQAAIDFARTKAIEYAQFPLDEYDDDEVGEQEPAEDSGWLYLFTYSTEGDSVWVLEKELEEEIM
jgi:hypothetical protein